MVYKIDEVPKCQKRLNDFFEQSKLFYFITEDVNELETQLAKKHYKTTFN